MEHQRIIRGIPAPALFVFLLVLLLPVHVLAAPTVTLITTYPSGAQAPAIFGNTIVWQDYRNGDLDIYLYNLSSGRETRITTDISDQVDPEIHGDLIVWDDSRLDTSGGFTSAIFLYNITTGQETQLSEGDLSYQKNPAIYGNRIVWSDDRTMYVPAICINGTSPGTETALSPASGNQNNPDIYGELVVWDDTRHSPPDNTRDIYSYSLATHTETRITDDLHDQAFPALFGSRIVWSDTRNGNIEIFMNGTAPGLEYSITPNQPVINHHHTAIYGPKVVWEQTNISGGTDIFMNDTSTGLQTPIAVTPSSLKDYPKIFTDPLYGDRIVWQDDRSGHNQVFLYSSTGPGTCPVAAFASNFTGGSAPVAVHFTDNTPPGSTHWFWDFGDGSNSTDRNPDHTYTTNDPFTVTLTVGNSWCRNATTVSDFIVVGKPVADFTASPTYGVMPVTVQFTDTSRGSPDTWNWSFGDDSWFNTTIPADKDAPHIYTTPGIYTVNLTVSNTFGTDTRTRTGYITVFNGANDVANTTIDGVSLSTCDGGPQTITIDTRFVTASLTPTTSVLEIQPSPDRGFETITVYALDGAGFTTIGPVITGHVTGVHLQTLRIAPTTFSPMTGPVSVDYSVDLPAYPCNALLNTQIWEGTTSDDRDKFETIALRSSFAHWLGTLYTTKITKTNFPEGGTARLHMSANASWVGAKGGHSQIYIEHIFDNRTLGEVLRTPYLFHDPVQNLDFFEADSPHGLSTFGLSALSGSGNPLQLITLTVTSHISPPAPGNNEPTASDSDSQPPGGAGAGKVTVPVNTTTATSTPTPVATGDPGKSAKVYTNADGVVSQATRLQSTDGRATVFIGEGVVAKDAGGKPLETITLKALPPESLPKVPSGSAFTYGGLAYEIGPDDATFSPPITLTLTPPQVQWGRDYSVKLFDQMSGTWQDLPTTFDATAGTVTAQVSRFCVFALFTEPRLPPGTPAGTPVATPVPPPAAPQVKAQPPATAVSIFTSMMAWAAGLVLDNAVIVAVVIVLVVAVFLVRRRRFPGP